MGRDVRVFEPDVTAAIAKAYSPLVKSLGLSGRAETRVSRRLRQDLRDILHDTIVRAYRDGSAPYRTGRSRAKLLKGIRVFGTRVHSLSGYIIGPSYIKAHEDGAAILPKRSKALAIPLPAALRPDGSPKLYGPRSWKNIRKTFIYKSKKTGKAYIAFKGASGRLTLLYVLVDEVQLTQHKGFLRAAWRKEAPRLMEALGQAMLFEMSDVDLLRLARVTYKGRRVRSRGR